MDRAPEHRGSPSTMRIRPGTARTMNTTTDTTTQRNPGIDLLRGLSILLVVLHHLGLRMPLKTSLLAEVVPKRLLGALNYNGYEAVFVFFVISGFLIATNSLQRWERLDRIGLRAFYVRRGARILPCLVLLVGVLSLLHLAGFADYVIQREGQSLPRAILAVFGLHLNWYEGVTGYLPGGWDVLWSLSIEEVFYLGFPLVCLAIRNERALVVLLALLAWSMPFSLAAITDNEIWKEKAYLPGMSAIALGVIAALVATRWPPRPPAVVFALGGLGIVGIAAVMLAMPWLWPLLHDAVLLVLSLATACLLVALQARASTGHLRALPGSGWLRSMGRLSYEIYLGHMFVVFAVVAAFKASGGDARYGFLWYVPAVLLAWLLGAVVAHAYSIPCDRALRRRLLKSSSSAPALAVS